MYARKEITAKYFYVKVKQVYYRDTFHYDTRRENKFSMRGISSVVGRDLPKVETRVRFPYPA